RRFRRAIRMTSPLRRKRPTTAPGRSTPIRTLAKGLGLGLLLVGGTAIAQNWVPATSPYGTWRTPAPAGKPAPNSWREMPKPATPALADPTPPPAPGTQEAVLQPAVNEPEPLPLMTTTPMEDAEL